MADEILIFDAVASAIDGTNPGSALSVGPGTSYNLLACSYPAAPLNVQYASSVDTEGELPISSRYGNRTITVKFDMVDAAGTLLAALQAKFAKFQREGGTLKRTMKNGDVRIYDIIAADGWSPSYDFAYYLGDLTEVEMQLPARPLSRGVEVDLGDNVETTLPVLVFTDTAVTGDAPALGRLVIDNDDASNDQAWVVWGIQSRNYDSAASAALFYEAEGRTAMGGSATAVGPSGASGAGSNVMRNTALTTTYQAILSTQVTGAGAHLSHIGEYRVFARVQVPTTNTGTVGVALEWADGSFRRFTQNVTTDLDPAWEGSWRVVDLGSVSPRKVAAGTQRWEGRILAASTIAGDDIDIDWLCLVPVDEGSGEVLTPLRISTPTAFTARDEFNQVSGGVLVGETLPSGGTWSGAGDATDFTVDTGSARATRSSANISDRYERASTGTLAGVIVRADLVLPIGRQGGLFARYTDTSNHLLAYIAGAASPVTLTLHMRVAGIVTILDTALIPYSTSYRMELVSLAKGDTAVFINGRMECRAYHANLATGGTLATGGYGMFDSNSPFPVAAGFYDNFAVFAPVTDAAIFASQSLELRHDRVRREDPGGTLWDEPSDYAGDYLRVPPAGPEARTARVIVKASRFVPGEGPDSGTDDISARLFITPRFLT